MNVHLQWTTGSDYEIHQFSTLLDRLRYLYSFMHVLFTDFPNFDKKKKKIKHVYLLNNLFSRKNFDTGKKRRSKK